MSDATDKIIKQDIEQKDFTAAFKHIYEDLTNPNNTSNQEVLAQTASKILVDNKILPGITIVGVDTTDGANGTGIIVDDQRNGIIKERYTVDPNTGIARSEDGKVQAIFYPNGTVQRFDYDDKTGKLTGVSDAKGTYYEVGPDGSAKHIDKESGEWITAQGNFKIDQKTGEITIENADKTREVHRPDGSMVKYDGERKDAQGNPLVLEVQFAYDPAHKNERGTMKFDYDDKGKLTGVKAQNGDTWKKTGENKWQNSRPGAVEMSDADFSVGSTGSVTIRRGNSRETYNPDGSKDIVSIGKGPNGAIETTIVTTDRNGKVTEVRPSNGNNLSIEYNGGKVSVIVAPEGTYTRMGNTWNLTDSTGKVTKPQVQDVKVFPDGTVVIVMPDGQATYQNGIRTFRDNPKTAK